MQNVRAKTMEFLNNYNLPIPYSLPVCDDLNTYQTLPAICERMIALFIYSFAGEGLQKGFSSTEVKEHIMPLVDKFHAQPFFSAREWGLVNADAPTYDEIFYAVWSYEALYILMGAVGLIENELLPCQMCDPLLVDEMCNLFLAANSATDIFVKMQLQPDIKERLDRTYVLHWLARRQRFDHMQLSINLIEDVIYEWHKALNWLYHSEYDDWDEVPTNT